MPQCPQSHSLYGLVFERADIWQESPKSSPSPSSWRRMLRLSKPEEGLWRWGVGRQAS